MMLRQNATPVQYNMGRRPDNADILTSGQAGVIIPVSCGPLFRGDSASGRLDFMLQLAEMPKPLENAVLARIQAWVVPRPALPQFSGLDEYTHAYNGQDITALGASNRTPPSLYDTVGTGAIAAAQSSEFFKALGLCLASSEAINTDYIDAYNLVANYRLAAHSSKMTRYDYYSEDATTALELKPAFWPRHRFHDIVPDYESAMVTATLDLDVSAGSIPVTGLGVSTAGNDASYSYRWDNDSVVEARTGQSTDNRNIALETDGSNNLQIFAEMADQTITTSLANIEKARVTNAMAKARTRYAGTNFSGFNNDDVIVSEFMQGFTVPQELMNRPWLLDSKTLVFGQVERHATDAANLEDSVTTAQAKGSLSINIPKMNYGGIYLATVEVMPEKLHERQRDEYLYATSQDDLPDALRDIQRPEPVDTVLNKRIDQLHGTPAGTYGFEPMNAKWRRHRTTLGGEFRQLVPGTPNTTARTAIWQVDEVDPALTDEHWLCPHPMNQDVFADTSGDCVQISVRQTLAITGLTQMGDALVEDNDEFEDTQADQA